VPRTDYSRYIPKEIVQERAGKNGSSPDQLDLLPPPVRYDQFEASQIAKPNAIVKNLLDSSSRMVFGGGSKTYKTWAMIDMALSIACEVPWWVFACFCAPVLYVNFELKPYYAQARFKAIRQAKGIAEPDGTLWIWNLRDFNVSSDLEAFAYQTVTFIKHHGIAVIFLDPFYKLLGEHDERVSAEIMPILCMFDDISRQTGTSTVTAAHYTKGNQSAKDPLDRISGGAAINRYPDSLIMLTNHQHEGSFTIDCITRDFPPIDKFVVSWKHPLLVTDQSLNPEDLKKTKSGGRKLEFNSEDLLDFIQLHDDEFSSKQLKANFMDQSGCGRSMFYELFKKLRDEKKIFESKVSQNWGVQL
jgi:hypothetical protein